MSFSLIIFFALEIQQFDFSIYDRLISIQWMNYHTISLNDYLLLYSMARTLTEVP